MNANALAPYQPPANIVRAWEARHYTSLQLAWHSEARERFLRMNTVGEAFPPPVVPPAPPRRIVLVAPGGEPNVLQRTLEAEYAEAHWILDALDRLVVPAPRWVDPTPARRSAATEYAMAHMILGRLCKPAQTPSLAPLPRPPSGMIKSVVCREWGITRNEMKSTTRTFAIARPRQVAMALHKEMRPDDSLPVIGRSFAHVDGIPRDHTTVLHAILVVGKLAFANPKFGARVAAARERIIDAIVEREAGRARHCQLDPAGQLEGTAQTPMQAAQHALETTRLPNGTNAMRVYQLKPSLSRDNFNGAEPPGNPQGSAGFQTNRGCVFPETVGKAK